jgi:hypothetical protein
VHGKVNRASTTLEGLQLREYEDGQDGRIAHYKIDDPARIEVWTSNQSFETLRPLHSNCNRLTRQKLSVLTRILAINSPPEIPHRVMVMIFPSKSRPQMSAAVCLLQLSYPMGNSPEGQPSNERKNGECRCR